MNVLERFRSLRQSMTSSTTPGLRKEQLTRFLKLFAEMNCSKDSIHSNESLTLVRSVHAHAQLSPVSLSAAVVLF